MPKRKQVEKMKSLQKVPPLPKEEVIGHPIRHAGGSGGSFETTVPRDILVREAKILGITLEGKSVEEQKRIIKREGLEAVWLFNSFDGCHVYIKRKEK